MIWLLSLLPERWLTAALRRKDDVFSVHVLRGHEVMEMAAIMAELDRPLDRHKVNNASIH